MTQNNGPYRDNNDENSDKQTEVEKLRTEIAGLKLEIAGLKRKEKWDYTSVTSLSMAAQTEKLVDALRNLGERGWELCGLAYLDNEQYVALMKRPK